MDFRVHTRVRHRLAQQRLAPQNVTLEDDMIATLEASPPAVVQCYVVPRTDERLAEDIVVIETHEGVELVVMLDDYVTMMIDSANRYHLPLAAMHPEGMRLALAGNDVPALFRAS